MSRENGFDAARWVGQGRWFAVAAIALFIGGGAWNGGGWGVGIARGEEKTLAVRKNYTSLTEAERKAFADAVLKYSKDKRKEFVAMLQMHNNTGSYAHRGPAFLPWHRAHMYMFEKELQKAGYKGAIPYWDWTVDPFPAHLKDIKRKDGESIPDWGARWAKDGDYGFMGGDGNPVTKGPFRGGEYETAEEYTDSDPAKSRKDLKLVRTFGPFGDLFSDTAYADLLGKDRDYDADPWNKDAPLDKSFRQKLEVHTLGAPGGKVKNTHKLHDNAHTWIGGHAGDPSSGADDPAFWMLHCNVDRLWAMWQCKFNKPYVPDKDAPKYHNSGDMMVFFKDMPKDDQKPADWVKFLKRGYTYDTIADEGKCKEAKALAALLCNDPFTEYANIEYDGAGALVSMRRNSDGFEATVADDIVVSEALTLGEFHWMTVDDDALAHTGADVFVFADGGGKPGSPVFSQYDVPSGEYRAADAIFGRTIFVNEVVIDVELPASGKYYVALRPVTDDADVQTLWLTAPQVGDEAWFRSAALGYADWTPVDDAGLLGFASDVAWCTSRSVEAVDPCEGADRGDSDGDGMVDFNDIDCFVAALIDSATWAACGTSLPERLHVCVNDINGDYSVDANDIDHFVKCLIAEGCGGM